ncbi:MAG: sensor histidine kinase, partial [Acidimicrobiales bacterium]
SLTAWLRPAGGASPVPVALSAGTVDGPGAALAGGVYVLGDLRRERELDRMKTEFLSRIGHELRTPLTGIMGFADLLTRKDISPELQRAWHGEILQQSKRLTRTVELLEFFAMAGAGRVLFRPDWLDLDEVLDEVLSRWRERLDGSRALHHDRSAGLPKVRADRRWLVLAVDELLDNAVKFSPQGSEVSVDVALEGASASIAIGIRDRGKGMTDDEAATAFGEFVQGDPSDTRAYGGLGLGLALVRRVAEAHGGWVSYETGSGRGTDLLLHLPLTPRPSLS